MSRPAVCARWPSVIKSNAHEDSGRTLISTHSLAFTKADAGSGSRPTPGLTAAQKENQQLIQIRHPDVQLQHHSVESNSSVHITTYDLHSSLRLTQLLATNFQCLVVSVRSTSFNINKLGFFGGKKT